MAYASKYYDPVKAHEYYERTKVLIGYKDRYGGSRGDGTSAASGGATKISKAKQRSQSDKEHNQGISQAIADKRANMKSQIQELRDRLNGMSKEDRKANRESIQAEIKALRDQNADEIQELREQTKGGSTSGFNETGHAAAAYIKDQMEKERDAVIKKANKDADNEMLSDVKKLAADIKAMRQSGRGYSHKQFSSKIKAMLGKTKKAKIKSKRKHTEDYKQRYKDEIDKLRKDKSMYSYYDRKREREEKEREESE